MYRVLQGCTDMLGCVKLIGSCCGVLTGSVSGNNFDIPVVPPGLLRPLQSVAPSGPWLFPAPDLWGDKVQLLFQHGRILPCMSVFSSVLLR